MQTQHFLPAGKIKFFTGVLVLNGFTLVCDVFRRFQNYGILTAILKPQ